MGARQPLSGKMIARDQAQAAQGVVQIAPAVCAQRFLQVRQRLLRVLAAHEGQRRLRAFVEQVFGGVMGMIGIELGGFGKALQCWGEFAQQVVNSVAMSKALLHGERGARLHR